MNADIDVNYINSDKRLSELTSDRVALDKLIDDNQVVNTSDGFQITRATIGTSGIVITKPW